MITLENFKTEIDDVIVDRGHEYYLDGMVTRLAQSSNGRWKAGVAGTDDYRVYITLTKNEIVDWECNCPYDWGPVCKHIVAVLYKLQTHYKTPDSDLLDEQPQTVTNKTEKDQISEILGHLTHEELKNFIQFYADENSEFKLEILSEFSAKIKVESKSDYIQIVKTAYHSAMDEWGFIEYGKEFNAVKPAQSLLDNARNDLDAGHSKNALEIAQAVLEESVAVINNADDSSGNIGDIVNNSIDILFEIAEQDADSKMRKDFFNWCLGEAQKQQYADFGWEDDLLDLSSCLIDDEKQEHELLDVLDKLEDKTEEELSDYTREKYAKTKLSLFKQRRSKEEVQRFLESNIHFSSFRKELIEQAIRKKDYVTAKNLALNGIDYDTKRHHFGTVLQWKEYLLKIAQLEKETETIRNLALELFSSRHSEIKYYRIWENTFQGKEKDKQIEGLINVYRKKDSSGVLTNILIEEKRFKDLLEVVKKSPNIYTIEMYESYLKAQFSGELVKLYAQAVTSFLERNTGRRFYREACRILRKMKKLGGQKTVKQLVDTLREQYPRRPALMDELSSF